MKLECSSCNRKITAGSDGHMTSAFCTKCKNLEIRCAECHEPITVSNKYGMFCAKKHGLKEAKLASKQIDAMIGTMLALEKRFLGKSGK